MTREDRRSLTLAEAALARLAGDWSRYAPVVAENIATMRRAGSCAETYLRRWEALMAAGPEALRATLLADSDEAQVLRSVHPLAGLLSPRERWDLLDAAAAGL
jgi:hypothetical protein